MAHHRGLIITLVVAVVVAAVGIGVMALATNDTDESIQDALSVDAYASRLSVGADPTTVNFRLNNNLASGFDYQWKTLGGRCHFSPPTPETGSISKSGSGSFTFRIAPSPDCGDTLDVQVRTRGVVEGRPRFELKLTQTIAAWRRGANALCQTGTFQVHCDVRGLEYTLRD